MEVRLAEDECVDAYNVAKRRYDYALAHYDPKDNSFISHLAGALGEVATEKVLTERVISLDAAFRDPKRDGEADILVGAFRIDVKTRYVYTEGARYPLKQRKNLGEKTSHVLWANELHNPHDWDETKPCAVPVFCVVWLFAWALAEEIKTGQVQTGFLVPTVLRDPQELFDRLAKR